MPTPQEVRAKLMEIRAQKASSQNSDLGSSQTAPSDTSSQKVDPAAVRAKLMEIRAAKSAQTSLPPQPSTEPAPTTQPEQNKSWLDKAEELHKKFDPASSIGDVLTGQLKGIADTALSVASSGSNILEKGYNATIGKLTGKKAFQGSKFAEDSRNTPAIQPENTAQKIGFGTEKIGEFLAPSGAVSKGAKVAEAALDASKLPAFLRGAAKVVAGAGLEGAANAGVTAAQGGSAKDVEQSALLGAASATAGKAIGSIADRLGNFVFSRTVPTTINQSAKDLSKGLDIGDSISNTGVSLTRKSLLQKIRQQAAGLGKELDSSLDEHIINSENKVVSIDDIISSVKSKLDDKTLGKKMQISPVDVSSARDAVLSRLDEYKKMYGDTPLNVKNLQEIKVSLGDGLESTYKKALDAPMKAKALTDVVVRSQIRKSIEEAVPSVNGLNKQLAPLLEAEKRIVSKGDYSGYLTDIIAGGFAAGNIGDIVSDPVKYFKNFALGVVAKRLGTSTAAKTTGGVVLKSIGKIVSSPAFLQAINRAIHLSSKNESIPDTNEPKK